MAPTTRSKPARISGFPDLPLDGQQNAAHKERPISASADQPTVSEISNNANGLQPGISDVPPTYIIDLSLPPAERYKQVAMDHKGLIVGLEPLFGEVVSQMGLSAGLITKATRLFLWRLWSPEQTEEIRGISEVTGLEMYLLVAFNVLLDLFMGCSSGGVRVGDGSCRDTRMLHFRTLDWGMDALRKIIVQLEFVEKAGGPVIARSITYAGFVGVLTGVRKDLSVSLNFRPYHDNDNKLIANLRFYSHHLLVLTGFRPSISCQLRSLIVPNRDQSELAKSRDPLPGLTGILREFPSIPTTAAYLTFSDGDITACLEKDRATAVTRTSSSFIAVTNHDVAYERRSKHHVPHAKQHKVLGMEDLVDESMDRKGCIVAKWERAKRHFKQKHRNATDDEVYVTKETLIEWVEDYPITNEETHFACVMDPKTGEVSWISRWEYNAIPDAESSGAGTPASRLSRDVQAAR